jgi:hypothetical protein
MRVHSHRHDWELIVANSIVLRIYQRKDGLERDLLKLDMDFLEMSLLR